MKSRFGSLLLGLSCLAAVVRAAPVATPFSDDPFAGVKQQMQSDEKEASAEVVAIDTSVPLDINGTTQWILERGQDVTKPVVLFVHGGPGTPLMPFSRAFDGVFLNDFVVVHWDQRDAGLSYSPDISTQTINLDQIVLDGLAVVEKLREKFHASKIILVGHSWGAIVASHMVTAHPEYFSGYVSVGTPVDAAAAEEKKETFIRCNASDAEKNEFGPPPYTTPAKIQAMSSIIGAHKAIWHNFTDADLVAAASQSKGYNWDSFVKGRDVSMKALLPFLMDYKADPAVFKLKIPVVFVNGAYDMLTPTELVANSVPADQLVVFKNSAHFAMYDEPQEFLKELKKLSFVPRAPSSR